MLRIGIVSSEKHWARQVATIFPEWHMDVESLEAPSSVLLSAPGAWDALLLDLDSVESHTSNIVNFMELAAVHAHYLIALIPPRFVHLEPEMAAIGIYALRKPTSSGEIGIALSMLFRKD
jgi:hypothetical protein